MIKGLSPNHSGLMTAVVTLLSAEFVGLAGYLGGYYDKDDRFNWLTFQWDTTITVYCKPLIFGMTPVQ